LQTDIVTVVRYDAAGRIVDRLHYGRDATADHKRVDVNAEDEARLGRERARSGAEKVAPQRRILGSGPPVPR
jgi:hypothetical protein